MKDPSGVTIKNLSEESPTLGDPRGKMVARYTPKNSKSQMILLIFVIVVLLFMLGGFPMEFLFRIPGVGIVMMILLTIYVFLTAYRFFIMVFDDMIFHEFGFYPPMIDERFWNSMRRKRTFIHFSDIAELSIAPTGASQSLIIRFRAHGRWWPVGMNWDTKILAPIFQMGVQFKRLPLPQETSEITIKDPVPLNN